MVRMREFILLVVLLLPGCAAVPVMAANIVASQVFGHAVSAAATQTAQPVSMRRPVVQANPNRSCQSFAEELESTTRRNHTRPEGAQIVPMQIAQADVERCPELLRLNARLRDRFPRAF